MYTFEEIRKVLENGKWNLLLTNEQLEGVLYSGDCFIETVLNFFIQPELPHQILLEQVPAEYR